MSRSKVVQIAIAALILFSGIVIGACGMLSFLGAKAIILMDVPPRGPDELIERMRKDLNLTDEQVEKVYDLFERKHQEREQFNVEMETKIEADLMEIESEMQKILTAEQFEKWQKELLRVKKRFNRGEGERRPSPFHIQR